MNLDFFKFCTTIPTSNCQMSGNFPVAEVWGMHTSQEKKENFVVVYSHLLQINKYAVMAKKFNKNLIRAN